MIAATRSLVCCLSMAATILLNAGAARADSLSPFDPPVTGGAGNLGTGAHPGSAYGQNDSTPYASLEKRSVQRNRHVFNVLGPLGLVVDNAEGLPRVRGLALAQGRHLRLEATGRVAPGFEAVTGQLSVMFRF